MTVAKRRGRGEGSVYRRKDGRFEGAAWVLSSNGTRKRMRLYAPTRSEAQAGLRAAIAQSDRGVPVPQQTWTIGSYLTTWLEDVVRLTRRPKTYVLYESTIRLHLVPRLGTRSLARLNVAQLQTYLNSQLVAGQSIRTVHLQRSVLSAALSRAVREELLPRNVARLVELPTWQRKDIRPWTADEAAHFLRAAQTEALYPAFLLLVLYGLRRGEVLGLRWTDIDRDQLQLQVRQAIQRVGGSLQIGPVKTRAGQRDLPLLSVAVQALAQHRAAVPVTARGSDNLIFTSRNGHPIEPRNLVRAFQRATRSYGLRVISIHHLRHTTATLLKHVGVPARDAQLILGHAHISTTQQLYQHADTGVQREGLSKLERLLVTAAARPRSRQEEPSKRNAWNDADAFTSVICGGPSGTRTHDTLLKSVTVQQVPGSGSQGWPSASWRRTSRLLWPFLAAVDR